MYMAQVCSYTLMKLTCSLLNTYTSSQIDTSTFALIKTENKTQDSDHNLHNGVKEVLVRK